jgi:hypothetical protein
LLPNTPAFPGPAGSRPAEILEDKTIQLVVSAAIPSERASLAKRHAAWQRFYDDKPGFTPWSIWLRRQVLQAETGRIYSIFSERLETRYGESRELVQAGASVRGGDDFLARTINSLAACMVLSKRTSTAVSYRHGAHQFDQYCSLLHLSRDRCRKANFKYPSTPS